MIPTVFDMMGGPKQNNQGLYAARSGTQNKQPADMWSANYANRGDPVQRYSKALRQQAFVRDQIFDPQYRKAVDFALDTRQPEIEAGKAQDEAIKYNELTRAQFQRMQERSGARVDPTVAADNDRLMKLNAVRGIADAGNMARQGTQELQVEQLGDATGLGINTARQALGLTAGAASAYTDRQNRNTQAEMMQKQAQAAATQANIGMAISIATTVAAIA